MSDTTITPEERALWASTAAARINAVTPERQCEITAQERLVKALKAIEQTEARAEKAAAENARLTKMVDWLADVLAEQAKEAAVDFNDYSEEVVKEYWLKEAARRAVADAESEVKG